MQYTPNIPGLVEAMIFLNLNRSLLSNITTNVAKYLIRDTLIPSHLALPDDTNDFDDNENEEDDDDYDDDLSPVPIESD